jgi:hypothetical protein
MALTKENATLTRQIGSIWDTQKETPKILNIFFHFECHELNDFVIVWKISK